MSTLKQDLIVCTNDQSPELLAALAVTTSELSSYERTNEIIEILMSDADNAPEIKNALCKLIFFTRPVTGDDDLNRCVLSNEFQPVFWAVYDDCAANSYQQFLAKIIVDYFNANPDLQFQIAKLLVAQRFANGFYGDPMRSKAFEGSEFSILTQVIDFDDCTDFDDIENFEKSNQIIDLNNQS
jgi:hypothetical protein